MRRILALLTTVVMAVTTLTLMPSASAMGPDNPDISMAVDTFGGGSIIAEFGQLSLTNVEITDGGTVLYNGPADTYQIAFNVPFDTYTVGQQLDLEITDTGGNVTSWTETLTTPGGLASRVIMQAELDAAELLFASVSQDYLLSYRVSCFCLPTGPVTVQVLNGQITQTITAPGPWNVQGQDVSGFFVRIQDAIDNAASLSVTYDPTYGYPTSIGIDWAFRIADDEVSYNLHGFLPTSNPNLPTCLGQTITAIGSPNDDTILGGPGDDVIVSFGGDDTVFGFDGDDRICAGTGDDEVDGGLGNDIVRGQPGDDTITGGAGNDRLFGGTGDDNIDGGDGNDLLKGFRGDDTLNGAAGNDRIRGSHDNDTLSGGDGEDWIAGQTGNDVIDAGADDDFATGNSGTDVINGGAGNDVLRGGSAADSLFGDAGDDTVSGGSGDDSLSGGPDTDACFGNNGVDTADATCETINSVP